MRWPLCKLVPVTLAFSLALVACKKRQQVMADDLGDAGYQLTMPDWFRAVRANDSAAMKQFLAAGFEATSVDEKGDSGLHAAAESGAQRSAEFLLNRGLPVDLRGAAQRTPLMSAVIADQTAMVKWLLRQGADPQAKDADHYMPLMLAVREGSAGSVAELAPYSRQDLDSAILLASLEGKPAVIDALTNYGASIYAKMEDGRTPLMLAAENGHLAAVKLLLDIGSNRFATDAEGRTAAELAEAAGHTEVAEWISRNPTAEELSLESEDEVAAQMEAFVEAASVEAPETSPTPYISPAGRSHETVMPETSGGAAPPEEKIMPLEGKTLSSPATVAIDSREPERMPPPRSAPLVMRHYRQREVPVEVKTVTGEVATLRISGASAREVKVRTGEPIPGSRLVVVRVQRRMEDSKLNLGRPMEVSVVTVRDTRTGATRDWIAGVQAEAHDPVALVEDAATGKRYLASPGQRFQASDGTSFLITDVRPNQLVIENADTGEVRTIPLSGPRG